MKNFTAAFVILSLSLSAFQSQGQLMKTVDDAHLIAEHDSVLFRGKPLKNLLKEIGPEIKMVSVGEKRDHGALSYITFYFVAVDSKEKPT